MLFKDYIKNNTVIEDGAMGTYYSRITGKETSVSEWANIEDPETIREIHNEYIEAGSDFILTNTFSVNTVTLNTSLQQVGKLVQRGYEIAAEAAGEKEVFIGADIGPIPEMIDGKMREEKEILKEYKYIIDKFYEKGAEVFVFETFSDIKFVEELSNYIKNKDEDIFVIFQLAVTEGGNTRKGFNAYNLITEIKNYPGVDAYGFNCGVGPAHLKDFIKKIDIGEEIISALPNAGYPEIINERTVYTQNADYFAEIMSEIRSMGVKIIGGCCGTTPLHIKKIVAKTDENFKSEIESSPKKVKIPFTNLSFDFKDNSFKKKLDSREFPVAVELDPPFAAEIKKIKKGAYSLKEAGVDIITITDSPLGQEGVDSVMLSAKIKREIGIETMPHLTCRDSNMIGLKSKLMAAHIEGIRNLLLVTGDPIPGSDRNEAVSVFNLNSFKLMELVQELNYDKLQDNSFYYGGALNLNAENKEKEWERMKRKIEAGAGFFFTQPIFEQEVIDFLEEKKIPKQVKIFSGILPLVSYDNARFLNNEFPGINIPQKYIARFDKSMTGAAGEETGINIALEILEKVKSLVDGLYIITPFNRVNIVKKIIKEM